MLAMAARAWCLDFACEYSTWSKVCVWWWWWWGDTRQHARVWLYAVDEEQQCRSPLVLQRPIGPSAGSLAGLIQSLLRSARALGPVLKSRPEVVWNSTIKCKLRARLPAGVDPAEPIRRLSVPAE